MNIAFRVDASVEIGTGHVVRCLTLARRLADAGAQCRFIMRRLPGNLIEYVRSHGHAVSELAEPARPVPDDAVSPYAAWLGVEWSVDADETERAIRDGEPLTWLVVDHYALDIRWEQQLRSAAQKIMVIDDLADRVHHCDILLDQNGVADGDRRYDGLVPDACQKLLGPRFALLRPAFADCRSKKTPGDATTARRALIYFGGVDKPNLSLKILELLAGMKNDDLQVDLVVGAANPHAEVLAAWCASRDWVSVHGSGTDMAALMMQADIAIGAGGTTAWERACLGLPSLVVALAANQEAGSAWLARQGAIIYVGPQDTGCRDIEAALRLLIGNPWMRERLGATSATLVDGVGTERVVRAMLRSEVSLRHAVAADSDDLLVWRNAPHVREHSLSKAAISATQHERWLRETLCDPKRDLLVGEIDGKPVGVLRFDHEGPKAKISVYLTPGMAGRGIGPALLEAGAAWLNAQRRECKFVEAEVLFDNIASHRAFAQAGYIRFSQLYRLGLTDED